LIVAFINSCEVEKLRYGEETRKISVKGRKEQFGGEF